MGLPGGNWRLGVNYYNEIDPYAAQWLRNLIEAGHIAPGVVDERSIVDVKADDLAGFRQCHFFAGIGVWSYALRLAGWPDDREVWTGSCPCQPFSAAGKQSGMSDERHLWPAWFRLIRECKPAVVFGEQVASAGVIGKVTTLQDVLRGKGSGLLSPTQSRWQERNLPRLREFLGERGQALAVGKETQVSVGAAQNAPGLFANGGCEAESARQGVGIRVGVGGYSAPDRHWPMRSNRDSVRPDTTEGVERSIIGSSGLKGGLHQEQYEGGALFAKHDGERLGHGPDFENRRSDQARTVLEAVEHLIAGDCGEVEEADGAAWIDLVSSNLVGAGYSFRAVVVPACGVGGPHIRQRLWFVADANTAKRRSDLARRDFGNGRAARWNKSDRDSGAGSVDGELAHPTPGGLRINGSAPGSTGHAALSDAVVLMADNDRQRQQPESSSGLRADAEHDAESRGGVVVMGDAERTRLEGLTRHGDGSGRPVPLGSTAEAGDACGTGPTNGHWRDADWIFCRDGRWRPVEPGTFPLAHGAPARVGRLRAYGNAIVPQVAAEVIASFLDTQNMTHVP